MRLLDVGHGARQVLRGSHCGVVHSVFDKAIYLRLDAGLVALTVPTAPPGPLHVRALELARHRVGQVVLVTAGTLGVGPVGYDLAAPQWSPQVPCPAALDAGRSTLVLAAQGLTPPQLSLGLAPGQATLPDGLTEALTDGDLLAVRRLLSGRGPGLTPSGDDMLAGILLVAHCLWGEAGWTQIAAAGDGSATGDVAAAFLHWAARGSCIEPVHHLLMAGSSGDLAAAAGAVQRLSRIGASSGTDLAFGVATAARWLPRQPGNSGRGGGVHPQQVSRSPSGVGP